MDNTTSSIHTFDFTLICEYFSSLTRQGPGSVETTLKALSFVKGLDASSKIADLGCGTGTQTLTIAENTLGSITALDLFPQFIDIFTSRIPQKIKHRLTGIVGSMDKLQEAGFVDNSLDLIWSEGAIYNIGFEHGINEWKRFLKTGGYIAVSDATWLTPQRPEEVNNFWIDAYPEINMTSVRIAQLEKAGYKICGVFTIDNTCWTTNFYEPQKQAQEKFLATYCENKIAKCFVESQRHEAEMFRIYHDWYGYVFYIAQKM